MDDVSRLGLAVGGFDEDYDGNWGYEDIDFAYWRMSANLSTGHLLLSPRGN